MTTQVVAPADFALDEWEGRAWIRVTAPASWELDNRSCQTCNETGLLETGSFVTREPDFIPCPDCFNGRYAFDIEVGGMVFFVSIVPDRIVPVEDSFLPSNGENPYEAMIVMNGDTEHAVLNRRSYPEEPYARIMPFRLAASCVVPATTQPGDWLVQVNIQDFQ